MTLGRFRRAGIVVLSRIRTTLTAVAVLLAVAGASSVSAAEPAALTLMDQFGQRGGLADDVDGLQVVIVVSAKRLRRIKPWEEAIRQIDADVPVIRVADVPRSPPAEYDAVADKFRKRLPKDLPVLIDLNGVWAESLGLDTDVPNVLIFDGSGTLLGRHAGMYAKDQYAALEADLAPPATRAPSSF
jgi:hypothetical protein